MRGLYIHIPFCIRKCKYCDFNSFAFGREDKSRYLKALFCEMEQYLGEKFDTVFIGGGTPTCLDAKEIAMLLDKINSSFVIVPGAEFSMESNPKTIDSEKLSVMRKNGVNRISIGIQSFDDAELAAIGRIHNAQDAEDAFYMARSSGFENINIDLMSAVPHQTTDSFDRSLEKALMLSPEHISCYSLILEENTPLYDEYYQGKLILPDEDTERSMYDHACKKLQSAGYNRYEISNFSKPGYECRHNIKYWKCREYIGLGLSAHSYTDGRRSSNTDDFASYINMDAAKKEIDVLSVQDKMSEFMFMGLRMSEGVSERDFFERFSEDIDNVFGKQLLKFQKMGMIIRNKGQIFLSDSAVSVSNQIMCEFIL